MDIPATTPSPPNPYIIGRNSLYRKQITQNTSSAPLNPAPQVARAAPAPPLTPHKKNGVGPASNPIS